MKFTKDEYFQRQTTLSEIGKEGQQLLQNTKVLVIGCGGLGSPIAIYLAASGIGELHLVDFDTVSVSNLHRQVFFKVEDVAQPKAQILAEEIKKRAPFSKVSFTNKAIDKASILELVSNYDIIVDGTDNLQIKYLINDACVITKKPLVYGSLYKFDGYVATFNVLEEEDNFSCNLRDAFPEIATDIPNCEEAGTLNPIVGIIALMQVNEVLKLVLKKGSLLTNALLIYNALENSQFKMKLKKNESMNIEQIFNSSSYIADNCEIQDSSLLISSSELKEQISNRNIEIISVLNQSNTVLPIEVHQTLPYKTFNVENFIPNYEKQYVIICKRGITSYNVTLKLKQKFPELSVLSLDKGMDKFN